MTVPDAAVEAGAQRLMTELGSLSGQNIWRPAARAVLEAASETIACGCTWDSDIHGAGFYAPDEDCKHCGGSGVLHVLRSR